MGIRNAHDTGTLARQSKDAQHRYVPWASGATVVHVNPVRFDVSSQEHFLEGPASVMVQSLLNEAFG